MVGQTFVKELSKFLNGPLLNQFVWAMNLFRFLAACVSTKIITVNLGIKSLDVKTFSYEWFLGIVSIEFMLVILVFVTVYFLIYGVLLLAVNNLYLLISNSEKFKSISSNKEVNSQIDNRIQNTTSTQMAESILSKSSKPKKRKRTRIAMIYSDEYNFSHALSMLFILSLQFSIYNSEYRPIFLVVTVITTFLLFFTALVARFIYDREQKSK